MPCVTWFARSPRSSTPQLAGKITSRDLLGVSDCEHEPVGQPQH
jgi:hypothetical protein